MLTDIQAQALQRLPRTTHVWQGDLRSLDALAQVQGVAGGLTGVFWVDETTAAPRSIQPCVITQDHQKPPLLFEGLVEAMLSPLQGKPGRPRQVIVCRREYQLYLRGVLQNFDIHIEYRPQLLLLNDIIEFLARQLGSPYSPFGTTPNDLPEDELLEPEELPGLRELYQQAVGFRRRAPWDYVMETPPLAITLNQWGVKTLYACILGGSGLLNGVAFYYSAEDVQQLQSNEQEDPGPEQILDYDAIFVHFQSEAETHPQVVTQFETYEWPRPNKDTFTDIGRIVRGQGLRPLGRTEVKVVQTVLCALNQFLSKQGRNLREFPETPVVYPAQVPDPRGRGTLTVEIAYTPDLEAGRDLDAVTLVGGPMRDDLFPDGMTVLHQVLPWGIVKLLLHAAQTTATIPEKFSGLPVVLIGLKPRSAVQVAKRLREEEFLGIFFSEQHLDGEPVDFTLAATRKGGIYLLLDISDDPDHHEEIMRFQAVQQKLKGGHGLVIVKDRRTQGSSPDLNPEDVVAVFLSKGFNPVDLTKPLV